jgi:hypothetical protein
VGEAARILQAGVGEIIKCSNGYSKNDCDMSMHFTIHYLCTNVRNYACIYVRVCVCVCNHVCLFMDVISNCVPKEAVAES